MGMTLAPQLKQRKVFWKISLVFDIEGPQTAPKPKNLGRHSDTDLIHTGHPRKQLWYMQVLSPNFMQYLWEL